MSYIYNINIVKTRYKYSIINNRVRIEKMQIFNIKIRRIYNNMVNNYIIFIIFII